MSSSRLLTLREFVALALIRTAAQPVGNGRGLRTLDPEDALAGAVAELRSNGWEIRGDRQAGRRHYRLIVLPTGVSDRRRAER